MRIIADIFLGITSEKMMPKFNSISISITKCRGGATADIELAYTLGRRWNIFVPVVNADEHR